MISNYKMKASTKATSFKGSTCNLCGLQYMKGKYNYVIEIRKKNLNTTKIKRNDENKGYNDWVDKICEQVNRITKRNITRPIICLSHFYRELNDWYQHLETNNLPASLTLKKEIEGKRIICLDKDLAFPTPEQIYALDSAQNNNSFILFLMQSNRNLLNLQKHYIEDKKKHTNLMEKQKELLNELFIEKKK